MELSSLQDLYVHALQDLYSAEQQLLKALPVMAGAASSQDLKATFEAHLLETREHVSRLVEVLQLAGAQPEGSMCEGMAGLLAEGKTLMDEESDSEIRDAGLVVAAQKVEHYEIAGYGSVRAFAEILGATDAVNLLTATLDEEKATDDKLTDLAMSVINIAAAEVEQQ